jgi:tetratricopeptide (TPR) repeat protein
LYARLSVFVGGFTLEAAEEVCQLDGDLDILEGLTVLVNNSLLRMEEAPGGEARFRMLETVRAYALERLQESGEMERLRELHARHFSGVIMNRMGFAQLYSVNALHWLNWCEREHDNIRAALTWCLSSAERIPSGAGLVIILFWFWYRRGYFTEGRMWSERLLASPALQAASRYRTFALTSSGLLAVWQGEQDAGFAHLQQSMQIHREIQDEEWITSLQLMANGVALINMGQDEAAQPLFEGALKLFTEQNNLYFQATTLVHLGNAELGLGHSEQARRYHEEALAAAHAVGENWLVAFALNNLGEVARTEGQYALAREYYEESERLLRASGDQGDVARCVHSLGYVAQHEDRLDLADAQFRSSLAMFRRLGNRRGIAECLAGLAGLKARHGQAEGGAVMLSAAESVLETTGGAWWPADRAEVERTRAIFQSALTETEYIKASRAGRAMNIDQAVARAADEP